MPIGIILPKFGFTVETSEIVQWLKAEGDTVRAGDPICEVTTDKVNMEVEAPESGTLHKFLYPVGAVVNVTEVIAYMLRPGEEVPADFDFGGAGQAQAADDAPAGESDAMVEAGAEDGVYLTPVARRIAEEANLSIDNLRGSGRRNRIKRRDVEAALQNPQGKVRATPAARSLAAEYDVALNTLSGSGPKGRIQEKDVEAEIARKQAAQVVTQAAPLPQVVADPVVDADAPQSIKLSGMRATIATRLQQSFQTAPHVYLEVTVDLTAIDALRAKFKSQDKRLSVTSFVVKACAWTLMQHPRLNAHINGDEVLLFPTANIGVAVALDNGLVVPVIHHAERLNLGDIQQNVDTVVERARTGSLHINDMQGGTFTITNLGMYGMDKFTAIINPPQVAILAVGRGVKRFVPDAHGQPVLQHQMTVTLSIDHRVVDGADAALFMRDLRKVLEDPNLLLW